MTKTSTSPIKVESHLIPHDYLDQNIRTSTDYIDSIDQTWGKVKAYYTLFDPKQDDATAALIIPILKLLGHNPNPLTEPLIAKDTEYRISHTIDQKNNQPPLHIINYQQPLDKIPKGIRPRYSPHQLIQEYLVRSQHLWGIITNGTLWRIVRDSPYISRLSYIQFDLAQIANSDNYADYILFYRLMARSRFGVDIEHADQCFLESHHQTAKQQGGRVRDKLRDGVEKALCKLGTGFLKNKHNTNLRSQIDQREIKVLDLYRQLLLLIYRLLFLIIAESRDALLVGVDQKKRRVYQEFYSISSLRSISHDRDNRLLEGFEDKWCRLKVAFSMFDENCSGKLLELSPLNGNLFGSNTLSLLSNCELDNHYLVNAIFYLSLYEDEKLPRLVNYAALDIEELGSVYESLLDFTPVIENREFKLISGSERKTTGSYYTPPELVSELVTLTLEPIIKTKLEEENPEQALLNLKLCDPSCGSGHFLLAASRKLGRELAKVRTKEVNPDVKDIKIAIRDVIQHCIYGVDLNPLAIDLCKVALWIEGFYKGVPLNFLDHRIKCGNSLIGVVNLDCLDQGIPDEAFNPVIGDDKGISVKLKKRNKKERENRDQLSFLFVNLSNSRLEYSSDWELLDGLDENTTDDIEKKQALYLANRANNLWNRDWLACNLWTSAFFVVLNQDNISRLPTTEQLNQVLRGHQLEFSLPEDQRFFHWCLEFPEVFSPRGGFDCILGNPPWERIKLQEKEFFASRDQRIVKAKNKAERDKLIKELASSNPSLLKEFESAKHHSEAESKFMRESGRFPLTGRGDINTYSIFAETTRKLINSSGRVGIIVPTGIATDDTGKYFWGDLIRNQSLVSLFDFENRKPIFSSIHRSYKFSLLVMSAEPISSTNYSFFLSDPKQILEPHRVFQLSSADLELINPNTLTCPVFRTAIDAKLTKKIYQLVPVLDNEKTAVNPWGISFMRMLDMANDSNLFENQPNEGLLPLYEAKMFHQFDHRWASYNGDKTVDVGLSQKQDPNFQVSPRYWVRKEEVERKLSGKWNRNWLLGFRNISNATNKRTFICGLLPLGGMGHSSTLIIPDLKFINLVPCLIANLNSIVFDYVVRQKAGGTNLSLFIVRQLPVIPPNMYSESDIEYIKQRVLELVYTSYELKSFALDMGYEGEPFKWDEKRRSILRAELDAKYAKLYGLTREELNYILDPQSVYGSEFPSETFRVLRDEEIKEHGEYRTGKLVLSAWELMIV